MNPHATAGARMRIMAVMVGCASCVAPTLVADMWLGINRALYKREEHHAVYYADEALSKYWDVFLFTTGVRKDTLRFPPRPEEFVIDKVCRKEREAVDLADAVMTVSEADRERVIELYGSVPGD